MGHNDSSSKRRRRKFSDEFKRDAVELVRATGRPIAEVAAELGIYDSTLGNWVPQRQIDEGARDGLTTDEKAPLRQLEAENADRGWSVIYQNEPWPSGWMSRTP